MTNGPTFCMRILILLFPLVFSQSLVAQSGRRVKAQQAKPASEHTASKEATNESKQERGPILTLLIAQETTSKHFLSEDTITASFVKRLNEYQTVTGKWIGELNRNEAIKRAQSEADAFVVFVQFDVDRVQRGTVVLNTPDLQVKYYVFAPHSGEQKLKGKIYYQAIGGAKLRKENWPNGPAIKITPEATGIELAERVFHWAAVIAGIKSN